MTVQTPFTYHLKNEYTARTASWSDIVGHLPTLRDAVLRYPSAVVLELGTRSGNSTAAFLCAVDEVDGHVWSVDIEPPEAPGWWADTGRWTVILGDDTDEAVIEQTPPQVDVLFVDTSHAYEHTLTELRIYVPRVKPGGVVLLHDTELESPEGVDVDPPYPVARALDTYCEETGQAWRNNSGSYGLGIIDIPEAGAA